MKSEFFNRPIRQQYLLSCLFLLSIFWIGYLLFIVDIEREAEQQMQLYHEKKVEIELLQARLTRYQASKSNSLSLISEKELAQAIEHNHLALSSFKHYEDDSYINWEIELYGKFVDFIALITSLNDDYYYLDFHHLMINKQDQQLQITFTLLFKKEVK